jgi:hypothetical protein
MFEAYVKKNAGNVLLAVALWVCPSSYGSNLPEPKAEALLRQMTLEEKVGQLVQISSGLDLTGPGPDDAPTLRRAEFEPGTPWPGSDGVHVNAHGGNIVFYEGLYYWYGSHKIEGRTESQSNEAGVRCYTSKDLYNWENAGMLLSKSTEGMDPEVADAGILDRPKVAFNDKIGRFLLYFKLYPPTAKGGNTGTRVGYVGVAESESPLGPFEYRGRFLAANSDEGSGDFAIFKENGRIHHITVRKPDKWLYCGRMSEDGLRPDGPYVQMEGIERATEAPAVIKHEDKYYLLGSGSSGWKPNAARMFVADQLIGPYAALGNPCEGENSHNGLGPEKTFGGQSCNILTVPDRESAYIAMFDIWKPRDAINSGHIWLPMEIHSDGVRIEWRDRWDLSFFE